ncbi:MAG TPA: UDP-diphosphatase [Solibacterales bacterium]|nr:UDP-diphosphatase [Bryobacterales bacterium]
MPLYQVILLAVVQGFTEFLPISSSAHLALAPWLLGWRDQGLTFDIALHFGTLAAVLIYFFRDWMQVAAQGFGLQWGSDPELKQNPRLLWLLAAASLPIGFFGFVFKHQAETNWRSPFVMGTMLIVVGMLMWLTERYSRHTKHIGDVTLLDAMTIGIAQAVAIIPGTSRSGITITAAMFRGFDRPSGARFSFLLSTPAITAAAASAFYDLYKMGGVPAGQRLDFVVGIAVSAVTGCLVIAFFLRWLRHHTLRFFVLYRIVFGILVIALALLRR